MLQNNKLRGMNTGSRGVNCTQRLDVMLASMKLISYVKKYKICVLSIRSVAMNSKLSVEIAFWINELLPR